MGLKKLTTWASWIVFSIATTTYILTVEPTTSWWDCGEFIAAAFKLQVGHPPGAPFFLLMGRIFTLFTFGQEVYAALAVNIMSALSSSFTIYFLFLIAVHLFKKIVDAKDEEYSRWQTISILTSAGIAALTYTFTDSFWFSAVEGEVYAMSSLFTAVVVWCIFKWEENAQNPGSDKWLVLIAYLMGLSIGVHLLNLLTIPALAAVFYSKRYKTTAKGYFYAVMAGIALLLFIQYGIVQGLLTLAIPFELYFVNTLGMSLWSGALVYFALILLLIIIGLYFSYKYQKAIVNMILNFVLVILIGYSSYSLIVIRSLANPPMDENNPENLINLLAYLNREQYGNRPLFYGQFYNAPVVKSIKDSTYVFEKDAYKTIQDPNVKYEYDPAYTTLFPRMYSSQGGHVRGYRSWAYINSPPQEPPTFIHNLVYAFRYQLSFMYVRYLMWNFAGRQNDTQGYGNYDNGNWISGISILDAIRLGNQSEIPDFKRNHPSRNTYFLLPFLIGILGLIYLWNKNKNYFLITTLLFVFTGIAIVFYVNQPPFQPRERDYSYVGSFYVFALWIGYGSLSVFEFLSKKLKNSNLHAFLLSGILFLALPVLMAFQNWDDHDRSNRYSVREIAKNFLKSCEQNAIIFTYGDNDTFPLWYVQEVENFRTDVRVVNLSLLSADWYITQMMKRAYDSPPIAFILNAEDYALGQRDFLPVYHNPAALSHKKMETAPDSISEMYSNLYAQFMNALDSSDFETKLPQDYKTISSGPGSLSFGEFSYLVNLLSEKDNAEAYGVRQSSMLALKKQTSNLNDIIAGMQADLTHLLQFAASHDKQNKVATQSGEELNYLPDSKVVCFALNNKQEKLVWELPMQYVSKSDLAALDIIASNFGVRPIYFAASMDKESMLGLEKYLQLDGFAYKLTSKKIQGERDAVINSKVLYKNLIENFKWGNIEKPDFYLCEHNTRTLNILNVRNIYLNLAKQLYLEGQKEKAVSVMDTCYYYFPSEKYAFNETTTEFVALYASCGNLEKSKELANKYYEYLSETFQWYAAQPKLYSSVIDFDKANEVLSLYEITASTGQALPSGLANIATNTMQVHLQVVAQINAQASDAKLVKSLLNKLNYEENIQAAIYLGLLKYTTEE